MTGRTSVFSVLSRVIWIVCAASALVLFAGRAWADDDDKAPAPAAEPAPAPAKDDEAKPAAKEGSDKAEKDDKSEKDDKAEKTESAPGEEAVPPEFDLPNDPKAYVTALRAMIVKQKEKILAKIETKFEEKQAAKMGKLQAAIAWFSLAGFLLLFSPLFLIKRYPGKFGMLFKYSLLASVSFIITVLMLSNVMLLLRVAQGAAGSMTNPTYSIAEAVFDTLDEQAEELAPLGPALLEVPLSKVASGEEDNFVSAILNNVSALKADVVVFKKIATWFKSVSGIFESLPPILSIITVILFVISMRPVLMKIVRLPAAAAAGEVTGMGVIKEVFMTLVKELVITVFVVFALLFTTLLAGAMLSTLAKPAVEALLSYVIVCIMYVLTAKVFSTTWVYVSLVGCMLFLVLNVGIVLMSAGSFVGKAQKLLRLVFHERVSIKSQWKFWVLAPLALIWVQVVPLIFILIAQPAVEHVVEWVMKGKSMNDVNWPALLGSGPLILVIGFLLTWVCWGLKPLLFIMRYPSKSPTPAVPGANVPAGQMMPAAA